MLAAGSKFGLRQFGLASLGFASGKSTTVPAPAKALSTVTMLARNRDVDIARCILCHGPWSPPAASANVFAARHIQTRTLGLLRHLSPHNFQIASMPARVRLVRKAMFITSLGHWQRASDQHHITSNSVHPTTRHVRFVPPPPCKTGLSFCGTIAVSTDPRCNAPTQRILFRCFDGMCAAHDRIRRSLYHPQPKVKRGLSWRFTIYDGPDDEDG